MPSDPVPPSACHVGVVFGGASGEHAVSIRSANTVVGALRRGANAERYRLSCSVSYTHLTLPTKRIV